MESRGMERARDQEPRTEYGSLALAGLKPAHSEPFCDLRQRFTFSVSQLGLGFCYNQESRYKCHRSDLFYCLLIP